MKLFLFLSFHFWSFVLNGLTLVCYWQMLLLHCSINLLFSRYMQQAPVLFQGSGHSLNPTNSLIIFSSSYFTCCH
ncbi:hypothetical protein AAZX31_14G130500 [Glycine max]